MRAMIALEPLVTTPYGKGKVVYFAGLGPHSELVKVHLVCGEMAFVRIEDIGFDDFRFRPRAA